MLPLSSITRKSTRKYSDDIIVITADTHECYQLNMSHATATYYSLKHDSFKTWNHKFRPVPVNYHIHNSLNLPIGIDGDIVLSQNKFGQYQVLSQYAEKYNLPLICLEHTLPVPHWNQQVRDSIKSMRGDINVFISEYSVNEWGFSLNDPTVRVIHHGVSVDTFKPDEQKEKINRILCVVNDWKNRDWCMPANQMILTKNGYKTIDSIKIGDMVLSDNGIYNKVNNTIKRKYSGKIISIDIGKKLLFTPDHNIRVFRKNINNQWCYLPASRIKKGDILRFPRHIQTDFTITDSEYAWLLGLIIGDGHITKNGCIQISFKSSDEDNYIRASETLKKITCNKISKNKETDTYFSLECSSKIFGNWLSSIIYEDKLKIIPECLINSSSNIRVSLLSGLFDADGSFKNGKKCKRFCYTTNSYKLASQVSSIIHSIGCQCSINSENRLTNKSNGLYKIIYRVVGYGNKNVNRLANILSCIKTATSNINYDSFEYVVKDTSVNNYDDYVYNCEVDNNPSYVVYPGFVAHNCCNFSGFIRTASNFPCYILGDTPGLSKPATSVSELVDAYQTSRIFYNTSTISPVPSALLEAMSCGCAVVSTATCMIPEIIQNGVNGFISNNEDELKNYLYLLLNNEDIAIKMGLEARKTILEKFHIDRFVSDWNKIFLEATNIEVCQ